MQISRSREPWIRLAATLVVVAFGYLILAEIDRRNPGTGFLAAIGMAVIGSVSILVLLLSKGTSSL